MSLMKINWNPVPKELRNFGRIAAVAMTLLAISLYGIKGLAMRWCLIIVAAGFLFFLCSKISIRLTKWIYLGLILLTFPIGIVVSFVLLAAFYYLLLTPIGLVFRLMGRDSLRRKFDSTAKSYWIPRRPAGNVSRYFHQF